MGRDFLLLIFFQFVFIFFSLLLASIFIKPEDFYHLSFLWFFFILFISGTSNFFNFMDGIDGIASITAIVAFAALGFFAFSKSANQDWQFFCFLIIPRLLVLLYFYRKIGLIFLNSALYYFRFMQIAC